MMPISSVSSVAAPSASITSPRFGMSMLVIDKLDAKDSLGRPKPSREAVLKKAAKRFKGKSKKPNPLSDMFVAVLKGVRPDNRVTLALRHKATEAAGSSAGSKPYTATYAMVTGDHTTALAHGIAQQVFPQFSVDVTGRHPMGDSIQTFLVDPKKISKGERTVFKKLIPDKVAYEALMDIVDRSTRAHGQHGDANMRSPEQPVLYVLDKQGQEGGKHSPWAPAAQAAWEQLTPEPKA
jgi:hypothetical protein